MVGGRGGECSIVISPLSKLRKARFFTLCGETFLVRLQGKFQIDHSWEWHSKTSVYRSQSQHPSFLECSLSLLEIDKFNCTVVTLPAGLTLSQLSPEQHRVVLRIIGHAQSCFLDVNGNVPAFCFNCMWRIVLAFVHESQLIDWLID